MDEFADFGNNASGLSMKEMQNVLKSRQIKMNERPIEDFHGMSAGQMNNWLRSDFEKLEGITINTPQDLSQSPVMVYLDIMIKAAIENDGSLKLTDNGYLPTSIVKACDDAYESLDLKEKIFMDKYSDFKGKKEVDFIALIFTRILAEASGIFKKQKKTLSINKKNIALYQKNGIRAFFIPVWKAATYSFNWAYFDGFELKHDFRLMWVFLVWRLSKHGDHITLTQELIRAFPALLEGIEKQAETTQEQELRWVVNHRFIRNILLFFGFVKNYNLFSIYELKGNGQEKPFEITSMFSDTFKFDW